MLQIRAGSWLFRWAYLFTDKKLPAQTDVCTLFWRSVVLTPLGILLIVLVGASVCAWLVFILWWMFRSIHWLGPIGGSIVTVLLGWAILVLRDKFCLRNTTTLNAINLVSERLKSAKHNYCVLVEVTHNQ